MRHLLQPAVWKVLKGRGWMRNMDIAKRLGKDEPAVHNALSALIAKGSVEKIGHQGSARYRATNINPVNRQGTHPNSLAALRGPKNRAIQPVPQVRFATELERCWR